MGMNSAAYTKEQAVEKANHILNNETDRVIIAMAHKILADAFGYSIGLADAKRMVAPIAGFCGECGKETKARNRLANGQALCGACKREHQRRVRLEKSSSNHICPDCGRDDGYEVKDHGLLKCYWCGNLKEVEAW
jgi:thymidine kinase